MRPAINRNATASGSALVEVCAAMSILGLVVVSAFVAHLQALAAVRSSIEYREAAWIAAAVAESLRARDADSTAANEWRVFARAALADAEIVIVDVSDTVALIEVSWVSRVSWMPMAQAHEAFCSRGNRCVVLHVGRAPVVGRGDESATDR